MKKLTVPTYSYEDTSDENVKRFVDRDGDWTHYFLVKENRFVKAVNHILRLGYPKGQAFFEYLRKASPEEADRKLKTAGEEGTRTHDAIRYLSAGHKLTMSTPFHNGLNGKKESLNNDEWDNIQGFMNWCEKYKPEMITDNVVVYSLAFGYAGTPDLLCTVLVPDGDKNFPQRVWGQRILLLPDWKSSSGLWPEYDLQVSAYMNALLEMVLIHGQLTELQPFISAFSGNPSNIFGMLVRIGTRHKAKFEVRVLDLEEMNKKFDVFRSCIDVAKDQQAEFKPEIEEIPMEFQYKMETAILPIVITQTGEGTIVANIGVEEAKEISNLPGKIKPLRKKKVITDSGGKKKIKKSIKSKK